MFFFILMIEFENAQMNKKTKRLQYEMNLNLFFIDFIYIIINKIGSLSQIVVFATFTVCYMFNSEFESIDSKLNHFLNTQLSIRFLSSVY